MGNLTALGDYIDNLTALPLLGAASALDFFAGTQVLAFDFYPLLAEPERLTKPTSRTRMTPRRRRPPSNSVARCWG